MDMTSILLNGEDPFEQIVNILSTERRPYVNHVKSVKSVKIVSKKKTLKDYTILYIYIAQGQRTPVPYPSKILTVATVLLL